MWRKWLLFLLNVILPTVLVGVFGYAATESIVSINAERSRYALQTAAEGAAQSISSDVQVALLTVKSVAAYWAASAKPPTQEGFTAYAESLRQETGTEFLSLEWVDADNVVRYVEPLAGDNLKAMDFDNTPFTNRMQSITRARETMKPVATDPIMLAQGYPGVIIYVPIFKDGAYQGEAVGVLKLTSLLGDAASLLQQGQYQSFVRTGMWSVPIDGKAIYSADGGRILDPKGDVEKAATRFPVQGELSLAAPIADKLWFLEVSRTVPPPDDLRIPFLALGALVDLFTFLSMLKLYQQRLALESVGEREKEFVSLVSHQLRSPLTQLSWAIDALLEDQNLPPERADLLTGAKRIAKNGVQLINQLLNLSRLERGVLKAQLEEVSVEGLIEEILLPFREEAGRGRFAIRAKGDLSVKTDRVKTIEAIRNIVDNALKYAPKDSVIEISSYPDPHGKQAVIAIRDRGPGVPEKVQPRLFEKSTGLEPKGGESGGAGLGLFLTKQFVELVGGSVRFESSPAGTTFYVKLPLWTTNR